MKICVSWECIARFRRNLVGWYTAGPRSRPRDYSRERSAELTASSGNALLIAIFCSIIIFYTNILYCIIFTTLR